MTNHEEALLQRIEQLEKELTSVKRRMNELESKVGKQNNATAFGLLDEAQKPVIQKQQPIVKKEQVNQPIAKEEKPVIIPNQEVDSSFSQKEKPVAVVRREPVSFEQLLGVWLPRVFMVVLILGVLWGLKIGMDLGWISYGARIVLGYVFTVGLYLFGEWNVRKGHVVFGLTLFGGLMAIGILVTMAGFYLYGLFPFVVAFMLGLVYIVFGLWMSFRRASETLTVLSGFAGFLLPFLIVGSSPSVWTFCLYMLALFLSLFYIAIRFEHKVSYVITFGFFQLALLVYTLGAGQSGEEWFVVGTALIQHGLFLYFYVRGQIARHVFAESLIYTNVVFMMGWIALLDEKTIVYGIFALIYIGLAFYARRKDDLPLQGVFSAVAVFAISVCILSSTLQSLETEAILLLINGTVGLWVGMRFKTVRTIVISGLVYMIASLNVVMNPITEFFHITNLAWGVLLVTMVFIYYTIYQYRTHFKGLKKRTIDVSLIAGQMISFVYIFHLSEWILSMIRHQGFWVFRDHLQLTILVMSLVGMFFAFRWKHGKYIAFAAVIEFLLLGIFFIFTPMEYATTGVFSLLLLSELFYFGLLACLFVVIWKNKLALLARLQTSVPIFAFILQIVYFYMLHKWYFAMTDSFILNTEYIYLGHTLWMFLFAFLSISIGIRYDWSIVKYVGISLIGVCLIKLFFIDLINVSIIVRAALFIIVGIAGLIYSRLLIKNNANADE